MAQVESNWILDYDEVSAFLSEIDDGCVLPFETPDSVVNISPSNKVIRSKKPRRYPRLDIVNTRRELVELELQLQILQEKHEFYESLKAAKSMCGLDWRLFAARERMLMKKSTSLNARLLKRVKDNNRLLQRICRLNKCQPIESMSKSAQISCQIVSLDNEAHVRRVLQACLDIRMKSQIDSIVNQCSGSFKESDLEMTKWNTFAVEDIGVGVEFHESVIVPFSASFIKNAIKEWPSVNSLGVQARDASALDRHLSLRRLVQVRSHAIVLWEDAFCCQNNTISMRTMVRGSGWALVAPVDGHQDDMSVVYSGGFVQIHQTDRSRLQPTDQLATDIVAYVQRLQRCRMTKLEDILIDSLQSKNGHQQY